MLSVQCEKQCTSTRERASELAYWRAVLGCMVVSAPIRQDVASERSESRPEATRCRRNSCAPTRESPPVSWREVASSWLKNGGYGVRRRGRARQRAGELAVTAHWQMTTWLSMGFDLGRMARLPSGRDCRDCGEHWLSLRMGSLAFFSSQSPRGMERASECEVGRDEDAAPPRALTILRRHVRRKAIATVTWVGDVW